MRKPVFSKPSFSEEVTRILHERISRKPSKEMAEAKGVGSFYALPTTDKTILVPIYQSLPNGRNGMLAIVNGRLYFYFNGWIDTGTVIATGGAVVVVSSKDEIDQNSDDGVLFFTQDTKTLYIKDDDDLKRIPYRVVAYGDTYVGDLMVGDLWYDTTNSVLLMWNGTDWVLISAGGAEPSNAMPENVNRTTGTAGVSSYLSRGDHRHAFVITDQIGNTTPALSADNFGLYVNKGGGALWGVVPAQIISADVPSVRTVNTGQDIVFVTVENIPALSFRYTTDAGTGDFSIKTTFPTVYRLSPSLKNNVRVYYDIILKGANMVSYKYRLTFTLKELFTSFSSSANSGDITINTNNVGYGTASGYVDVNQNGTTPRYFALVVDITRRRSAETGMPSQDDCWVLPIFHVAVR